jgi:ABC-2 type transport system ATP-binding protein
MQVLEIENLSKHFKTINAVDGLNLTLSKGMIFGFLGLNGAGKTTTLRMITGLANPTGGSVIICGDRVKFGDSSANKHVGYLPDVPEFYGFMRPKEYLELSGRLCGLSRAKLDPKIKELLELVGLSGDNRRIGGFSRGMRQRLGIAQALIHDPELLILDEPTSALDPIGRKEILDIISALKGRLTVLFSTHILSDVERICDNVGILHHGHLVLQGSLEDIHKRFASKIFRIEVTEPDRLSELRDAAIKLPFVRDGRIVEGNQLMLSCSETQGIYNEICPMLTGLRLPLTRFEPVETNLEDVFIEVIKDE